MSARYYVTTATGRNPWRVELRGGISRTRTGMSFYLSSRRYFATSAEAVRAAERGNERLRKAGRLYRTRSNQTRD